MLVDIDKLETFVKWCYDNHKVGTWGDTNINEIIELLKEWKKEKC